MKPLAASHRKGWMSQAEAVRIGLNTHAEVQPMTTFAPRPADVPERLQSLHATVRAWADHIPQTLPYVDLMFAFGFATLGDRGRADSLVEAARKAMVVPIPERWTDNKTYEAVASGVTTNFLFKAFRYRVDQALAGKPHVGPLSDALQAGLEEIAAKGRAGSTANPYLRAE
jgi:hypothetical protein